MKPNRYSNNNRRTVASGGKNNFENQKNVFPNGKIKKNKKKKKKPKN